MVFPPHQIDDLEPLAGTRIAIVMLLELHTVFPGFIGPPGGNDVKRKPIAVADVIYVGSLLGEQRRIMESGTHCHHQLKPSGHRGKGGGS